MRGMHLAGIEALCRRMDFLQVPAGGIVLRQGDVGDAMFMVYKGTCQIYSRYGSSASQAGAQIHSLHLHSLYTERDICTATATSAPRRRILLHQ